MEPNLVQIQSIESTDCSYPITFIWGCGSCILNQRDIRRLKITEMKFTKRTAGYSLWSEDIL